MLALLSGVPVAGVAYVASGAAAAAWSAAGSLGLLLLSGAFVSRWACSAVGRLSCDAPSETPLDGLGVFRPVVEKAAQRIAHCDSQTHQAVHARTELEARMNVRRRQIRRLEGALSQLDQPLLITDPHDQPLFCNSAAAELLQQREDDSQHDSGSAGQSPRLNGLWLSEERTEELRKIDLDRLPGLRSLLETTRTRHAATKQRTAELETTRDGQSLVYRARATGIGDEDGTLLAVVTILEDIRNEQQEKTRHAEFVSSVCHELKTPMAGIKAYTEMLADGDVTDPDEQQELFGFIEAQVDRLTRLVNNMLNLARIESGVIKVQREDCSLNDVLERAAGVVRQLAEEKQQQLLTELSELYLPVHVDQDLFGQAIINLLSNAVKYTPEGGTIRLRSRLDENQAVIEVRDTGMGIPESSLPRIFDRFYRVPENNKSAAGTGLGLSLVHYIVTELHNGTISVDSRVDEGTTFTVSVPLGHIEKGRKKPVSPVSATPARPA